MTVQGGLVAVHHTEFRAVSKDELAFLGTGPIPTAPYIDPEYFELERRAVFGRSWLHVGRESEISEADSFIVRDIQSAGVSVLLTRSADGDLRAFHNVCRHRGSRLVSQPAGSARSFSCPYHMWTFANDGRLRAVPDEAAFYDLDRSGCGLVPVSIDTVGGFVFVNLDRHPEQDLATFLGPIGDEFDKMGFVRLDDFLQYSCEVESNWKTAYLNFQETYHVRWVHAASAGGRATSPNNPFGYPSAYRFYDRHGISTIQPPTNPRLAEVQARAYMAAGNSEDRPCSGCWDLYFLYPNLFVAPLNGSGPFTMQFWPSGPDRTRLVVRVYSSEPDLSPSRRFYREYAAAYLMDVHVEDFDLLELNHRGLKTGVLDHINFQSQEAICRNFHQAVDGAVNAFLSVHCPSRTIANS